MSSEKIKGLVGAGTFHLVLILILLFTYMKPMHFGRVSQAMEGIPVMFGNAEDAGGDTEPLGRGDGTSTESVDAATPTLPVEAASSENKPSVATTSNPTQVMTQTHTQTVAVKTDAEKRAEEKKRQEDVTDKKRKEEEARKARIQAESAKNIQNAVGGALGNGSGLTGSVGNTSGQGTQGSPSGNGRTGATSGIGGANGVFNLENRNTVGGGLVIPNYPDVNEGGKVVVTIKVDPRGNVISAQAGGKGSTTANTALKNAAVRAAQKTKFNLIKTPNYQEGTITYYFKLKAR